MSRVAGWCAFVVLAGLLAMHGLGSHGTMADHSSMPLMSPSASASAPTPSHSGHSMPDMTMCLALLGMGLAVALGLVPRDRLRRTTECVPMLTVATRARDPDPPDLERLSVRRC